MGTSLFQKVSWSHLVFLLHPPWAPWLPVLALSWGNFALPFPFSVLINSFPHSLNTVLRDSAQGQSEPFQGEPEIWCRAEWQCPSYKNTHSFIFNVTLYCLTPLFNISRSIAIQTYFTAVLCGSSHKQISSCVFGWGSSGNTQQTKISLKFYV